MNVGKSPSRNLDPRNRRTHMGLYLALLAPETQPRPEADILGKPRPNIPGGQKPPVSTDTRVRDPMQRQKQLLAENHMDQEP